MCMVFSCHQLTPLPFRDTHKPAPASADKPRYPLVSLVDVSHYLAMDGHRPVITDEPTGGRPILGGSKCSHGVAGNIHVYTRYYIHVVFTCYVY